MKVWFVVDSVKSWVLFCIFCVIWVLKDVVWWLSGLVKFLESNLIVKLKRDEENMFYYLCFGGKYCFWNIIFYFMRWEMLSFVIMEILVVFEKFNS